MSIASTQVESGPTISQFGGPSTALACNCTSLFPQPDKSSVAQAQLQSKTNVWYGLPEILTADIPSPHTS